ncbi:methyltransferase [Herbaspirillum rubrisubalbicans]|uniref:Methyltransferase n=1 Tax=Herbaspirillum rubrisubalbicans TaxID=80842 RepID=A0ABX9C7V0_9BURK|nr:class I SAM-dependent methyltransferase [Herbaspirillum rubrisubalbicans]RAM67019.1 methyltransferase [Herbaspirillum rubrisubalbicans]RAN49115.1 methyltransferase [Herbaspirillum rubrisubalbicans]
MQWHEGYVSDIDYVAAFFPEQSPALLSFACLLNGCEPPSPERHFRYLELGSGQGLTANILAAANPHADFYAVDFNPAHIAASRQLAQTAGLQNIHFLENSFADLAEGVIDLPPVDFITMHGVYSWVNADNRHHIMRLVKRYLKPGGIVYLSYNAMPGWTTTLPFQRLLLEHATLYPGSKSAQIDKARSLVRGLMETRTGYFTSNTSANLQNYLRGAMEEDASRSPYLAHEYMNQGWEPLYHIDVARDAAQAKLDYVGSADLSWAFPELYLSVEQRDFLQEIQDPGLRETVKDYFKNTCFRKDIYVRGKRPVSSHRQEQWFSRIGLALTVLRETVSLKMGFPLRQYQPDEEIYNVILDALAQGPKSLAELRQLPSLQGKSLSELAQLAALLIDTGQAAPYLLQSALQDRAPAQRLNQAIAQLDTGYRVFASPLLGSGVAAPLFQRLVYDSLADPQAATMSSTDVASRVLRQVESQHVPILLNERELVSEQEKWQEVQETVKAILTRRRPFWKQLLMLPEAAAAQTGSDI